MGRNNLYRWDEWFRLSGGFILIEGKEFVCSRRMMRQQIRNAAARRGISITIADDDDRLIVIIRGKQDAKTRG